MLNTSVAPWVVGREPLLEYAIDDHLRELGRATPWLGKIHEDILARLNSDLDAEYGLTPLRIMRQDRVDLWVQQQPEPETAAVIHEFRQYLLDWNWLSEA